MNRKNFIQNIARVFFLGAFAGGTIYLGTNGRISSSDDCERSKQCEKCGSFSKCSLPQAINQKNYGK